jgi:hypothetical protein
LAAAAIDAMFGLLGALSLVARGANKLNSQPMSRELAMSKFLQCAVLIAATPLATEAQENTRAPTIGAGMSKREQFIMED